MTNSQKYIYKYIGANCVEKVFSQRDFVSLKCSLPKDFNDPYELFLTIDFNIGPEKLAYYYDVVGDMPQHPTTCFSRSPIVVPMWAHYSQNHTGFAVEFSEEKLKEYFPNSVINDITYSDVPAKDLLGMLEMAHGTAKMRHAYFLANAVFSSAYFTKTTCWEYEQERRMVAAGAEVREENGLILLDVPRDCVTNIICGSRASSETKAELAKISADIGCGYLELRIGKSSATPYLIQNGEQSYVFDGRAITQCLQHCHACWEPIAQGVSQCSWCQIDEALRSYTASRNPFRILEHFGLLEDYIEGMEAIRAGRRMGD